MEDHVSVEDEPLVILAGLNEAEHVGAATTVTVAVQVAFVPAAFVAVRVHVCVAVGEKLCVPLAVFSVPLPRLPVQV